MSRVLIILFICLSLAETINCQSRSRDCQDVLKTSTFAPHSGIYPIQPLGFSAPFQAYCDFETGEGWTVIQRRLDGSVDFDRVWSEYREGFGDLEKEFWLGNDKMSALTTQKRYQLRIELTGLQGPPEHAQYSYFRVADEDQNYRLSLGTYSGTAGEDSFSRHGDMCFTTKDADHDLSSAGNCARSHRRGGWWYRECYGVILNADYGQGTGIVWRGFPGGEESLKFTEMKIRAI